MSKLVVTSFTDSGRSETALEIGVGETFGLPIAAVSKQGRALCLVFESRAPKQRVLLAIAEDARWRLRPRTIAREAAILGVAWAAGECEVALAHDGTRVTVTATRGTNTVTRSLPSMSSGVRALCEDAWCRGFVAFRQKAEWVALILAERRVDDGKEPVVIRQSESGTLGVEPVSSHYGVPVPEPGLVGLAEAGIVELGPLSSQLQVMRQKIVPLPAPANSSPWSDPHSAELRIGSAFPMPQHRWASASDGPRAKRRSDPSAGEVHVLADGRMFTLRWGPRRLVLEGRDRSGAEARVTFEEDRLNGCSPSLFANDAIFLKRRLGGYWIVAGSCYVGVADDLTPIE